MAYLGTKPANAVVTSEQLADGVVGTSDLASAAVTPAKLSQPFTAGTAVASTSGTSIDFTGIPSWVKRITVMYAGVSTNGTSALILQLGTSSGVVTSGYVGAMSYASAQAIYTTGIGIHNNGSASGIGNGTTQVSLLGSNTWAASGTVGCTGAGTGETYSSGSYIALGGTLDRVRITTVNGTDAFDAGTINILYE